MIDAENPVRLAVREDEDALFELCKSLHKENGLFSFSEPKVRDLMQRAFDGNAALMGVIGDKGKPEACIYLTIDSSYYSDDLHLIELWNFVHPKYRRGIEGQPQRPHARSLLEFAKHCATELGLPLVTGILSNQRVEAKVRLYERHLEKAGAFFVFNRERAGGTAWPA